MSESIMKTSEQAIIAELRGFRELMEERTENLAKTLDLVRLQCEKTNGRVTELEMINAENNGVSKISGIIWGAVTAFVVSISVSLFNKNI